MCDSPKMTYEEKNIFLHLGDRTKPICPKCLKKNHPKKKLLTRRKPTLCDSPKMTQEAKLLLGDRPNWHIIQKTTLVIAQNDSWGENQHWVILKMTHEGKLLLCIRPKWLTRETIGDCPKWLMRKIIIKRSSKMTHMGKITLGDRPKIGWTTTYCI